MDQPKTDNLEVEIKSMMERLKEMEMKPQDDRWAHKPSPCLTYNNHGHANNVEECFDDDGHLENGHQCENDQLDSDCTVLQVIDACFVEVNIAEINSDPSPWCLYSGASHHVYGDSKAFSTIHPSNGTKITSIGGHDHNITDVGSVAIQLPTCEIQNITHILYSLGITKKLLYVGFLIERGFSLEFKCHVCLIQDRSEKTTITTKRNPRNGLYKLKGKTITNCTEVLIAALDHLS